MLKVAILGANGFIGSRTVEILHLEGLAEVRPIVRRLSSLARLARFDLDCRIANGFDQSGLETAFAGCDVVIHAISGSRRVILGTLAPTYRAAEKAGVHRVVYLSSASVHGQAPMPGTDENSPLSDRQPIAYNNAKIQAERKLLKLRARGSVEVVMLRPGIVFGPRSSFVVGLADNLLSGTAYLVNEGMGTCNSVYVDNVVYGIYSAMTVPTGDREAFLLGDQEQIMWSDFYRPIAEALGLDLGDVLRVPLPKMYPRWQAYLKMIDVARPLETVFPLLPNKNKQTIKVAHSAWGNGLPLSRRGIATQKHPIVTHEMALLHQCQYKLPFQKARKLLGYEPIISFPEGCRRTIAWLAFAGYPILNNHQWIRST